MEGGGKGKGESRSGRIAADGWTDDIVLYLQQHTAWSPATHAHLAVIRVPKIASSTLDCQNHTQRGHNRRIKRSVEIEELPLTVANILSHPINIYRYLGQGQVEIWRLG